MTHISMNNQETVTNKLVVVEVSIHTSLRMKSMNTVNCYFLFSQEKLLNKYSKSERERKDTKKSKASLPLTIMLFTLQPLRTTKP